MLFPNIISMQLNTPFPNLNTPDTMPKARYGRIFVRGMHVFHRTLSSGVFVIFKFKAIPRLHLWWASHLFRWDLVSLTNSCGYHFRQLRGIRPYRHSVPACAIATSIVHSELHYGNSRYHNLSNSQITLSFIWDIMALVRLSKFTQHRMFLLFAIIQSVSGTKCARYLGCSKSAE